MGINHSMSPNGPYPSNLLSNWEIMIRDYFDLLMVKSSFYSNPYPNVFFNFFFLLLFYFLFLYITILHACSWTNKVYAPNIYIDCKNFPFELNAAHFFIRPKFSVIFTNTRSLTSQGQARGQFFKTKPRGIFKKWI